jgi:hypothetical protein
MVMLYRQTRWVLPVAVILLGLAVTAPGQAAALSKDLHPGPAARTTEVNFDNLGQGFRLIYAGNAHGLVVDTWRDQRGQEISYIGTVGAEISLESTSLHGHSLLTISVTPGSGRLTPQRGTGQSEFASILQDERKAGLPRPVSQFVAGTLAAALHASSSSHIVKTWCVSRVHYGFLHVAGLGTACDIRYLLQNKRRKIYIDDKMVSQDHDPNGTTIQKMTMIYARGNRVVDMQPIGTVDSSCQDQGFSLGAYGVSVGITLFVCGASQNPFGLSTRSAGEYYGDVVGYGGTLGLGEILETHTTSTDPHSTFRLQVAGN